MGEGRNALKSRGFPWRPYAVLTMVTLAFVTAAVIAPQAAAISDSRQQLRLKNRFRPRIVGTPRAGVPLRATRGIWRSSRPVAYGYRWLRCAADNTKCAWIPGATHRTFTPTDAEVGTTLRVSVKATNATGSGRAASRPTGVVSASGKERVVALWHLDETSGAVMADSAGADNGSIYQVALGAPGALGSAYGFNGQNSYVSVPSTNELNPGTGNITITLLLKTSSVPNAPPADFDLIRKGTYGPAASEYKVELQHSGQASCGFEGSAGYSELIDGPRLNDGRWHKVQCIKAPTAIQLVVDGKTFTQTANVGAISTTAPLIIGARPDGDWYQGYLDEISIATG